MKLQLGKQKDCLLRVLSLLLYQIMVLFHKVKTYVKTQLKLDENILKQKKWIATHKNVANIYMVYEINFWSNNQCTESSESSSLSDSRGSLKT